VPSAGSRHRSGSARPDRHPSSPRSSPPSTADPARWPSSLSSSSSARWPSSLSSSSSARWPSSLSRSAR